MATKWFTSQELGMRELCTLYSVTYWVIWAQFGFLFFPFFKLNLCIQQGIVCITAAAPEQPKQSATNEQIGSCQRVTHLGDCTAHWGCGILQCGKATKTHNHFWNGLITVYWSHLESNPRNLPTLLL